MRCPTLKELPPPLPGKSGWPWTEESSQIPDKMSDGSSWPSISIVTPSYNQGQFIEETIRSVLLQGYPNLEYVIIDGGSTDESINIVRKYEKWLTYWISEPDSGQSEAINKGIAQTNGTILTWLNSDDRLQPEALRITAEFFHRHTETGIVYGDYNVIDASGDLQGKYKSPDFDLHHNIVRQLITQPAALFRRQVWQRAGPLNPGLHYLMDRDLWTRAALLFPIEHISSVIADVRFHQATKTTGQTVNFMLEQEAIFDEFFTRPDLSPDIKALEPQARGANFLTLGRVYLKNKQYQAARQAFKRAWGVYPWRAFKLIILPFWLDSILKTNIGLPLFRILVRLKNPGQLSP